MIMHFLSPLRRCSQAALYPVSKYTDQTHPRPAQARRKWISTVQTNFMHQLLSAISPVDPRPNLRGGRLYEGWFDGKEESFCCGGTLGNECLVRISICSQALLVGHTVIYNT